MKYSGLSLKQGDNILNFIFLGQFELEKEADILSIRTDKTKNDKEEAITILPDQLRQKLKRKYYSIKNLADIWSSPGIYVFVISDTQEKIKYIGRASNSVIQRLKGYLSPGISQSTNTIVNKFISDALKSGKAVLIYFYPEKDTEKELHRSIRPEWNREVPKK